MGAMGYQSFTVQVPVENLRPHHACIDSVSKFYLSNFQFKEREDFKFC